MHANMPKAALLTLLRCDGRYQQNAQTYEYKRQYKTLHFLTGPIIPTVGDTATWFALLNSQDFKLSLLFFLLEYVVQEACYIRSK